MHTFLPALLNALQQYSYPVLWGSIAVAAIGVPFPISLLLLAMGACAALGDFNMVLLFVLALASVRQRVSKGLFRFGLLHLAMLVGKGESLVLSTVVYSCSLLGK